jgi:NADH-quinone oxidoreductase subunit G
VTDGNGSNNLVSITINDRRVQTEKGRLLIDVAEELGVFVPRFCYHPGMRPVAVCRMCLVKVEGMPKLAPACATPVDDGMKVDTVDEQAVDAQKGMLEFLLINHPLDCPICDRAGECPLQDQTYAHGPGSSRYVEPKRTYEKALDISDLVVLDRERCVLCWRCVRFCDEISGDRFIQLVDRGAGTQILTFSDEPFDSYFSGNTIQICPVGALTSKPYRFVSRPWDLESAPSVCSYCSVGCPITNESRQDQLVRCQALPNEQVNDFWICDKGRFGYHYVSSEERLRSPLVRSKSDEFEAASWGDAYERIADGLKGKERVGVLAGGHLTTEDAFAIGRLARKVLGTSDVDSRVQDAGAPYELALELEGVAGSSAKLADLENAKTIVWAGPDPKETLPVLFLHLRKAVIDHGARLVVVSPREMSLDVLAEEVVRSAPGAEAERIGALRGLEGPVVVCWGPSSPGRDETGIARAAVDLAKAAGAKLLVCPPHAGSQGMIDMGVHPGLEAGYEVVADPGKDTRAILEAAAGKELDALLIFGADLIADFPDAQLARRALDSGVFTATVELFPTETVEHSDVVLPAAAYAEREGTFTNLERRLQKLEEIVPPPGSAQEPWRICAGIAGTLGDQWGWHSLDDVWDAIRGEVKTHAEVRIDALTQEEPAPAPFYESGVGLDHANQPQVSHTLAGPGAQYPKGYRSGAPFQTGQSWPLSWELRAFEARQRPGVIPFAGEEPPGDAASSNSPLRSAAEASAEADTSSASRPPEATPASAPSKSADEDGGGGGEGSEGGNSHSFALYTGRFIYDAGSMIRQSKALFNLARKPFVEMNDEDATDLGVAEGDEVVIRGGGGEAKLPVRVTGIAKGTLFIPYDQEGLRANSLIEGVDPTATVEKQ